ncbi:MAG: CrcB family protein, partial [Lapillicoccus sp.]
MDHDRHHDLPIDPDLPDEPYQPLHLRPAALGLVLVGGMAGTGARLWAEESVHPWGAWPAATFLVNLVGAFVLGGLLEGLARRGPDVGWRLGTRLLVGTGFLGAFTTYSSLAVEAALLGRDSLLGLGLPYAVGSVVLGFLAC